MMDSKIKNLLLFFGLSLTVMLAPMASAESKDIFEQQKLTSHLLINLFLQKIDEDGLQIFDVVLGRDDLEPHHVSYVHKMGSDSLQVQLCFTPTKHILVPEFNSFYVNKITVEMGKDGKIIEVLTHVSPLEQTQEESE